MLAAGWERVLRASVGVLSAEPDERSWFNGWLEVVRRYITVVTLHRLACLTWLLLMLLLLLLLTLPWGGLGRIPASEHASGGWERAWATSKSSGLGLSN